MNGMVRVPITNWRMVRSQEMRARKSPTNEAKAIHQAQKNRVQSVIHVPVTSKAKVCPAMFGNSRVKSATLSASAVSRNFVFPATSTHRLSPIAGRSEEHTSELQSR